MMNTFFTKFLIFLGRLFVVCYLPFSQAAGSIAFEDLEPVYSQNAALHQKVKKALLKINNRLRDSEQKGEPILAAEYKLCVGDRIGHHLPDLSGSRVFPFECFLYLPKQQRKITLTMDGETYVLFKKHRPITLTYYMTLVLDQRKTVPEATGVSFKLKKWDWKEEKEEQP